MEAQVYETLIEEPEGERLPETFSLDGLPFLLIALGVLIGLICVVIFSSGMRKVKSGDG